MQSQDPGAAPIDPPPAEKTWLTTALIAVNVAMFVLMVASGVSPMEPTSEQVLPWGAGFGPSTMQGDLWRLITSAFIHAGMLHLAVNMYSLWHIGRRAETLFGTKSFAAVYVVSALGGSLASTAWSPLGVGVGASGAIFGIGGALLAFVLVRRNTFEPGALKPLVGSTVTFVGYNLYIGLMLSFVDNAAHVGGLVFGFISGFALLLLRRPGWVMKLGMGVALALALVGGVVGAHQRVYWNPAVESDRVTAEAAQQFDAGDRDGGLEKINRAIALAPQFTDRYFTRGFMYEVSGRPADAIADYTRVVTEDPRHARAWARRASLNLAQGNQVAALHDANRAVSVDPRVPLAHGTLASIHLGREEWERSRDEATKEIGLGEFAGFARLVRGSALAHLEQYDAALSDFDHVLAAEPAYSGYAHEGRSRVYSRQQKHDLALAEIDAAMKGEPTYVPFVLTWADVLETKGDLANALVAYDRAAEIDPSDATPHNNRAWVLNRLGRFDEAIASASRALELEPEHSHAFGTRCFARMGKGDERGALEDCERAVGLNPTSRHDLGMLCLLNGDRDCALDWWGKEIAERPEHASELKPWIALARRDRRASK
ncbi:MAG: rhomboid family intramembrane serine protease [Myxococcaceae bacterium]